MAMVYEIARRAGRRVRDNNLGHESPITFQTLRTVAQAHGAEVSYASLEPGQSGMIIKYAGSNPRIYISDLDSPSGNCSPSPTSSATWSSVVTSHGMTSTAS